MAKYIIEIKDDNESGASVSIKDLLLALEYMFTEERVVSVEKVIRPMEQENLATASKNQAGHISQTPT